MAKKTERRLRRRPASAKARLFPAPPRRSQLSSTYLPAFEIKCGELWACAYAPTAATVFRLILAAQAPAQRYPELVGYRRIDHCGAAVYKREWRYWTTEQLAEAI